jgi:hypothetical protein
MRKPGGSTSLKRRVQDGANREKAKRGDHGPNVANQEALVAVTEDRKFLADDGPENSITHSADRTTGQTLEQSPNLCNSRVGPALHPKPPRLGDRIYGYQSLG